MIVPQLRLFSQRDPDVRNLVYGFGTGTIGDWGCYVTALVNGLRLAGWATTIHSFNDLLKQYNLWTGKYKNYVDVANLAKKLPDIFTGFVSDEPYRAGFSKYDIKTMLNDPNVIILARVNGKAIGGSGDHFVLVVGWEGDMAIIHDPWTGTVESIAAKYGVYGGILGLRIFYIKPIVSENEQSGEEVTKPVEIPSYVKSLLGERGINVDAPEGDFRSQWQERVVHPISMTEEYQGAIAGLSQQLSTAMQKVGEANVEKAEALDALRRDQELKVQGYKQQIEALQAQVTVAMEEAQTAQSGDVWARFTSRKFLILIGVVGLIVANSVFSLNLTISEIGQIVGVVLMYLGVEGGADIVQRAIETSTKTKLLARFLPGEKPEDK